MQEEGDEKSTQASEYFRALENTNAASDTSLFQRDIIIGEKLKPMRESLSIVCRETIRALYVHNTGARMSTITSIHVTQQLNTDFKYLVLHCSSIYFTMIYFTMSQ